MPLPLARIAGLVLLLVSGRLAVAAPTHLVAEPPVSIRAAAPGVIQVDFGRVAFGNLELHPPPAAQGTIVVRFGEALADGRIDRHPPGSVRYHSATVTLGPTPLIVAPARDVRNTTPPAVLTPAEWGVLTPFRWVEIEGWPGELRPEDIRRRAAYVVGWNDDAAAFRCSDEVFNQIWELCRYSIKATTFAGIFVDGDRERIAYEADAYLNQLSFQACDSDPQMARDTFDRLLRHPTWPTEWAPHLVFMAYADWMQTGDRAWLAAHYDALRSKLLDDRVGPEGLVVSTPAQMKRGDIVDWPEGERDGFQFRPVNTVVNAFHLRALTLMSRLAAALGRADEATALAARESEARRGFQARLYDSELHRYRDGVGTEHTSVHASLFPLAFGLVPDAEAPAVASWLASRGMACSVYAAQYLLEGLLQHGQAPAALALITAPGDRSWRHMLDAGTTITWEAWDQRYKPNQDWNHAWGAAPANLLPRYVLGVQPLGAGWSRALIAPQPGGLTWSEVRVPTPRGPVVVRWESSARGFRMKLELPPAMAGHVELPVSGATRRVTVNGQPVRTIARDGALILGEDVTGTCEILAE